MNNMSASRNMSQKFGTDHMNTMPSIREKRMEVKTNFESSDEGTIDSSDSGGGEAHGLTDSDENSLEDFGEHDHAIHATGGANRSTTLRDNIHNSQHDMYAGFGKKGTTRRKNKS